MYLLNPDAIDCSVSVVNPEVSWQGVNKDAGSQGSQEDDKSNLQQCNNAHSSILHEKAVLFQQRFKKDIICLMTSI